MNTLTEEKESIRVRFSPPSGWRDYEGPFSGDLGTVLRTETGSKAPSVEWDISRAGMHGRYNNIYIVSVEHLKSLVLRNDSEIASIEHDISILVDMLHNNSTKLPKGVTATKISDSVDSLKRKLSYKNAVDDLARRGHFKVQAKTPVRNN